MTIRFFDCNATVGTPAAPILDNHLACDDLLAELDTFGIDQALINHAHAQELDYRVGNELLVEAIGSGTDRLHGVAVLAPTPLGRSRVNEGLRHLHEVLAAGFRAVRLDPNPTHHIMGPAIYPRQYGICNETVGPLLEALDTFRVPLFLDFAQVTWPEIYSTCRNYLNLPVVLLNVTYPHKRSLYGGLDSYSNLYVDTSSFHAYRGIQEITEIFGFEHLLFGTRLPVYNALAAIGNVMYADIGEDARAAIAGWNLGRLLAGVKLPPTEAPSGGAE